MAPRAAAANYGAADVRFAWKWQWLATVRPQLAAPRSGKFARFLLVGGVNTLFGNALFAILFFAGLQPELALWAATTLGVIFNFMTTGSFVFQNRDKSRIFRFVGVYVVVYLLNAGALR